VKLKKSIVYLISIFILVGTVMAGGYLSSFIRIPNAAISGHNTRHLTNVSPEDCARACAQATNFYCKSFDYYKNSRACDLSNKSAEDVGGLKTNYDGNPYDHYARMQLEVPGYTRTPNAAISGYNNKNLKNVTPQDCARACSAETSFYCKSFDFYKGKSKCDLSDKSAWDVGGLKTDYPGNPYDHYARN